MYKLYTLIILFQLLDNYREKLILFIYVIGDFIFQYSYYAINTNKYLLYIVVTHIFLAFYIYKYKKDYLLFLVPIFVIIFKIIYLLVYLLIYYNEINGILSAIPR